MLRGNLRSGDRECRVCGLCSWNVLDRRSLVGVVQLLCMFHWHLRYDHRLDELFCLRGWYFRGCGRFDRMRILPGWYLLYVW